MSETVEGASELKLTRMIGFSGGVLGGLKVHPDGQHLIYPVGCTIVIEKIGSKNKEKCAQSFLTGHTNTVTCIAVSKSGRFIASGQTTHMGFKADIIVWDYEKKSMYAKFTLHKVKVEALAFSPSEKFLLSIGGPDDGSAVIWNLQTRAAVCGNEAQVKSAGSTHCVAYANNSDYLFVTGGDNTLRVWELDEKSRKLRPSDVNMGQVKRIVTCIVMGEDDGFMYCGTTSGDIIGVNIKNKIFQKIGPKKDHLFSLGVTSVALLANNEILVGAGDGTVCSVKKDTFARIKKKDTKVNGEVTSIALRSSGHQFYVGTCTSDVYRFSYAEFSKELVCSSHNHAVNDITFPKESSSVVVTCGSCDIRCWGTNGNELLRIQVPNMTVNAVDISPGGREIYSAWNDGKIRVYHGFTGKLLLEIKDAHNLGVTAIAVMKGSQQIVSGGGDGQLRVWQVCLDNCPRAALINSMNEHKATVTSIKLNCDDTECVSSSTDGTCIIWDLNTKTRKQVLFSNTLFQCVCYGPREVQVITSGTDRKIGYWETLDGNRTRELDGSKSGSINGMDISEEQTFFATGGDDKLVKLWSYDDGNVTDVGIGHSSSISKVRISKCGSFLVSVSKDGAILMWEVPEKLRNLRRNDEVYSKTKFA